MPWNSNNSLSSNYNHVERQNTQIMLALKREISQLDQDHRYKLWQLDHDRKQFQKNHAVFGGKRQKPKRTKERKKRNDMNLVAASLDTYIKRWISTEFHTKNEKDIDVEDLDVEDPQKNKNNISEPSLASATEKRGNKTLEDSKTAGSSKDGSVSSGLVLPIIVVSANKEGSVVSRRTSNSFITKINEDDDDISPDVDDKSRKNSCIALTNSTRKLSIEIPARFRSTSLPIISNTVAFDPELPYMKKDRSKSMDTPRVLLPVRASQQHRLQDGRRCSVGVSHSRVIRDLSVGIMFRDLDDRQGTLITDEQWDDLKKCRYLRGNEPSP